MSGKPETEVVTYDDVRGVRTGHCSTLDRSVQVFVTIDQSELTRTIEAMIELMARAAYDSAIACSLEERP